MLMFFFVVMRILFMFAFVKRSKRITKGGC